MSKGPNGELLWDIEELAKALKISVEDVREYFTDGRRASFILERRIAKEILKGNLAPTEGAGFDIIDSNGGRWEVRSISRRGIYFCPSYMKGSGRSFNEEDFLNKLLELKGYIIADIESFPQVPCWIISAEQVRNWWDERRLGTTTEIAHNKALRLIGELK